MSRPHELLREQFVPRPLGEVFAFFADAENLQAITPPWLNFRILTPTPIEIKTGTRIDYKLGWHGIPMKWKTEITRWEPPHLFQHLQLAGPYKLWRHTHRFEESDGGTHIFDYIQYTLPLGAIGRVVHGLTVRNNVEQIFDFRYEHIRERFGGPART